MMGNFKRATGLHKPVKVCHEISSLLMHAGDKVQLVEVATVLIIIIRF